MALFKPGQSGNPSGRPKPPKELLDAQPETIKLAIWRFWKMTKEELQAVIQDPATPAGELFIATTYAKGIAKGDPTRLEFLLNRLIGKVKEERDINVNVMQLPSREEALQILAADYAMLPAPEVVVDDLE